MAKPESKEKINQVTVTYDLYDLPTAQHKAGLAGLVLQVESMKAREFPPESIPGLTVTAPTAVEATFTEASTRGLFDDLYDAEIVEVRSGSKWSKKKHKRVETTEEPDGKTGKLKKKTWYVYDIVQPRGTFLRQYTEDGKEIWHKLWREMLWAIPRGKPTTRAPFYASSAEFVGKFRLW